MILLEVARLKNKNMEKYTREEAEEMAANLIGKLTPAEKSTFSEGVEKGYIIGRMSLAEECVVMRDALKEIIRLIDIKGSNNAIVTALIERTAKQALNPNKP
jgi:hypothetical protein